MSSILNNMKKYNRKLYDEIEKLGLSKIYKTPKTDLPPTDPPKTPKFSKLKSLIKKI